MDLEEAKERYRLIPQRNRLLIMVVLGLLPAAYFWTEMEADVGARKQQVANEQQEAQRKFEKAKDAQARLPALQSRLADTEEQLAKVNKILPDQIEVDEVLHQIARIAKENMVGLLLFQPGRESSPSGNPKYKQMIVTMRIDGHFRDVASFLDRLVHLENLMHVRGINMVGQTTGGGTELAELSEGERLRRLEDSTIVNVNHQLVIFSATEIEVADAGAGKRRG